MMNLEQALDVLRAAAEHVPDTDAAPYDEALYAVRQAMFDMRSPDPRDARATAKPPEGARFHDSRTNWGD